MTTPVCKHCLRPKSKHYDSGVFIYCAEDINDSTQYEEATMSEKTEGLTPGEALDKLLDGKICLDKNGNEWHFGQDGLMVNGTCNRRVSLRARLFTSMAPFRVSIPIAPDPSLPEKKDWRKLLGTINGQDNYTWAQVIEALKAELKEELSK